MLSTQIIAQDADVEQCLPWVGAGYGFYGGGRAWFEAFYERPDDSSKADIVNPLGAAWQLHGQFLHSVSRRIGVHGIDGTFNALAGISEIGDKISILLSNYQYSDQLVKDLNNAYMESIDDECRQWMDIGEDGLFTGEFYTFKSPPAPPGLSLSGPKPTFCKNKTTSYGEWPSIRSDVAVS